MYPRAPGVRKSMYTLSIPNSGEANMNQEKFRGRRDFMRAAANIAGGTLIAPILRVQTPPANAKPAAPSAARPAPVMWLANMGAAEELAAVYTLDSKAGRLDVTLQCGY